MPFFKEHLKKLLLITTLLAIFAGVLVFSQFGRLAMSAKNKLETANIAKQYQGLPLETAADGGGKIIASSDDASGAGKGIDENGGAKGSLGAPSPGDPRIRGGVKIRGGDEDNLQ